MEGEYFPRKLDTKLERFIHRKEFFIIRGPRQSGKTTLLKHIKTKKESSEYITFQDINLRKSFTSDTKAFVERYLYSGIKTLLIDEAQYVNDIGERLKLIYDLYADRLKVIVTGSGNFDSKSEVGRHLVGRAFYFNLLPLSFEEFLSWRAKDLINTYLDFHSSLLDFIEKGEKPKEPIFEQEFLTFLKENLIFGSFPAVVKEKNVEEKKIILKNLFLTYLEKDVGYFFGVRNLEKFKEVLLMLALNISNLLEPSSVSQEIKLSFYTLQNYLEVLQQSFIIFLVRSFFKNPRSEIKKRKKLYFVDLGLRNAVIENFMDLELRQDSGELLENFVFLELLKNFEDWKISYWRSSSDNEVDFVITKEDKILPIEVKKNGEITRGFVSFLKKYKLSKGIVFSLNKFELKEVKGIKIAVVPAYFV